MKSCKTNPQLIATIDKLKAKTRETEAAIWRDIALRLEKPKRNWAEANLRYDFSDAAAKAIVAAGGKTLTIEELAEANPKGTGVRIMR